MTQIQCTEHLFANFKVQCEGEDDCIIRKCVYCSQRQYSLKDFHIEDNLDLIKNDNVFNCEKYFDK